MLRKVYCVFSTRILFAISTFKTFKNTLNLFQGDLHHMKEIEVNTALSLDDTRDYLHGDNSQIIATDSQKNTVYILAKKHGVQCIERFALTLSKHFLDKYPQVVKTNIFVKEKPWKRINKDGKVSANNIII